MLLLMNSGKVLIKKLNENAKIPVRAHAGDAGLDLYALESAVLKPSVPTRIQTGIALAIPNGHVGMICDRSSMGAKGIRILGGIVDSGYRGEVQVLLINLSLQEYKIESGDKIAQLLILPVNLCDTAEVLDLDETSRSSGGFGSTGK